MAFFIIRIRPVANIGVVHKKMSAILALIINDIVREKISINGERTAVLIIII